MQRKGGIYWKRSRHKCLPSDRVVIGLNCSITGLTYGEQCLLFSALKKDYQVGSQIKIASFLGREPRQNQRPWFKWINIWSQRQHRQGHIKIRRGLETRSKTPEIAEMSRFSSRVLGESSHVNLFEGGESALQFWKSNVKKIDLKISFSKDKSK